MKEAGGVFEALAWRMTMLRKFFSRRTAARLFNAALAVQRAAVLGESAAVARRA